jgi:hypothetical protein
MVDADRSETMTDHAVAPGRCRADRPDAVGELALASVDVVIVGRRTNHEVEGREPVACRPEL